MIMICARVDSWAQVHLSYRYDEEVQHRFDVKSQTEQTLTIAGTPLVSKTQVIMRTSLQHGVRGDDGILLVQHKTEQLQAELQLPNGITLAFDSAQPDKPAPIQELQPIMDLFRFLSQESCQLKVDRQGKLLSASFAADEIRKLPETVQRELDPTALLKQYHTERGYLPNKPLRTGDEWVIHEEHYLGAGQSLHLEMAYRYAGEVTNMPMVHRFMQKPRSISYTMQPAPDQPLKVVNSRLQLESAEGEIVFDERLGIERLRTLKLHTTGELTLEINQQQIPATLNLMLETQAQRLED